MQLRSVCSLLIQVTLTVRFIKNKKKHIYYVSLFCRIELLTCIETLTQYLTLDMNFVHLKVVFEKEAGVVASFAE